MSLQPLYIQTLVRIMGSFGNIHMLHLWPVNALGLTCGGKTDWANLEWRRVDTGSAHIFHTPNSEPDIL